ncbi:MAG: hypothetical protein GY719_25630 [bacterium]|nr:hypothetical protein [bacterium]
MARRRKKAGGAAREVDCAGASSVAFANSGVPRRDNRRTDGFGPPSLPLEAYGELIAWGCEAGILGTAEAELLARVATERPEAAAAVLATARALRTDLMRIFSALALESELPLDALATLNAGLSEILPARRLVPREDRLDWGWAGEEGALDRVLWPVIASAGEVLTSDDCRNLRQCAARGCLQLYVDRQPRPRRRFWCDMNTCGNRGKGQRYWQQRKAQEEGR